MRFLILVSLVSVLLTGCNNSQAPDSQAKKKEEKPYIESAEAQHYPNLPKDTIVIDYYNHRSTLFGVRSHGKIIVEGDMIFRLPTWWSRLKDSLLQKERMYSDSLKRQFSQPLYFFGIGKPSPGWPVVNDTIQIHYKIDRTIKNSALIIQAIHKWELTGIVHFILATKKDPHVLFKISTNSQSEVGNISKREQLVWLRASDTMGTIIHEIGHVIGLFHEQCRSDRGNYLIINCPGSDYSTILTDPIGLGDFPPYNLYSIMHYAPSDCISVKNANALPTGIPGQRDSITANDLSTIRFLYHIF